MKSEGISILSLVISIFTFIFTYVRTKETVKATKLKQSETVEEVIELIESIVPFIKEASDVGELEKFGKTAVKDIKKTEVILGKHYGIVRSVIDPMWESIREKQNYLQHGMGKLLTRDGYQPPTTILNDLEMKIPSVAYDLRKKFKV